MRAGARPAAFVFGAVLALGCSDDARGGSGGPLPIPGCEAFSHAPCDILSGDCERELFALMACARGETDPGEPPSVRLLNPADAAALIVQGGASAGMSGTEGVGAMPSASEDEQRFRAQVRGVELLGLIDPGQVVGSADVVNVMLSSVIAYYLVTTQEIVIIDRGAPLTDLDSNGVLAHELVHALQDRRHGLGMVGGDIGLTSDGSLALASLVEGEASLYQDLYMLANEGAALEAFDLAGFYTEVSGYGTRLTLEARSPLLTAPSIFPYTHGARYVARRWLQDGAAGLDALFLDPPRTTLQVLEGAGPISAWDAGPVALDGYELLGDDVAGAWVTVAMLAGLPPSGSALPLPQLARRWRGDRFWVYASAGEPAAVAALWAIDWADAATASAFAEVAAGYAPPGAALALDTSGRSTRLCVAERAADLDAWRARLAEAAPPAP